MNFDVPESKFIDFAMAPSKAVYIFFGHLKRDTPLDAYEATRSPARCETTPHSPGSEAPKSHLQRGSSTCSSAATAQGLD